MRCKQANKSGSREVSEQVDEGQGREEMEYRGMDGWKRGGEEEMFGRAKAKGLNKRSRKAVKRHLEPDSAACHQAGEQSLPQQPLTRSRGVPTVEVHMMPGYRPMDGKSLRREESERETDHPQRAFFPKTGYRRQGRLDTD
jgi:hypothetical protein